MLLAIDTSTSMVGIALFDGEVVLSEMIWESRGHHTVELVPAIVDMLARTSVPMRDIGAVSVAMGPGSFTGLRIGLAVAKGIALSQNCALIGIPTMDVIAKAQPPDERQLVAVLRAGRKRLATAWYEYDDSGWLSTGKLATLTAEELKERIDSPTIVCGEIDGETRRILARRYKNVYIPDPALCVRRPAIMAQLAWSRFESGELDDPVTLSPIYLHHDKS